LDAKQIRYGKSGADTIMTTNLLAILTSAAEGTLGELTARPRAGRGVPRQPCSHRRRRPHQRRQWPARIENHLLISRRTPSGRYGGSAEARGGGGGAGADRGEEGAGGCTAQRHVLGFRRRRWRR
jgi:hypothetical protein